MSPSVYAKEFAPFVDALYAMLGLGFSSGFVSGILLSWLWWDSLRVLREFLDRLMTGRIGRRVLLRYLYRSAECGELAHFVGPLDSVSKRTSKG